MAQYVVVRTFSGPDGPLQPGMRLDESSFRPLNLRKLLERRFVQPAPVSTAAEAPVMRAEQPRQQHPQQRPQERTKFEQRRGMH
ncbi:MAG: hypothetical protein KGL39_22685 [Patescibacteria group bacterium]|nr:hypothetical protein [Patescibacteria group bacterium]